MFGYHSVGWNPVPQMARCRSWLPCYGDDLRDYCNLKDVGHEAMETYLISFLNCDPRFASNFWRSLQNGFGYKFGYEYCYHPQTDGQSERTIQTLEDMLRACAIDFANRCRSPVCWTEVGEAQILGPELIQETTEKIIQIKQRMQATWVDILVNWVEVEPLGMLDLYKV
ncbi:putative reverse transcriptase domain-containing protein [Tanacetum coccineum]